MSKFCPFCDDVKDSELDTPEKFKQHLEDNHKDQVFELGPQKKLDKPKQEDVTDVEPKQ